MYIGLFLMRSMHKACGQCKSDFEGNDLQHEDTFTFNQCGSEILFTVSGVPRKCLMWTIVCSVKRTGLYAKM